MICFWNNVFIITFIIDRQLFNRGTGISIATDCNTVEQQWEHFGKPHVPLCWREWISTAQQIHTDLVNMAAHNCICVMMRINTENDRQMWRLQGENQKPKSHCTSLSLLASPLSYLTSVTGNPLPVAFAKEVTSFPVSNKKQRCRYPLLLFVCVYLPRRYNVSSKCFFFFSTYLYCFISTWWSPLGYFFLCWLTDTHVWQLFFLQFPKT